MKKLFFIGIILLLVSCNQNKQGVELVKNESNGYSYIQRQYSLDGRLLTPVYKVSDEQTGKMSEALIKIKEILANEKSDVISEEIKNYFKSKSFVYSIYVNENGFVQKLIPLVSQSKEVDKLLAMEMKNWLMEKYLVKDEPTKYIMNWTFELVIPKNDSAYSLLNSNINVGEKLKEGDFNKEEFFISVEEMPSPIGGIKAIQEKVQYPEIAKRAGIEGRVYIKAYIDENGNVTDTEILKGLEGGCSEVAAEAVKNTKFNPGRQKGNPVKVQVIVPILFKLDSNGENEKKLKKMREIEEIIKKINKRPYTEEELKKYVEELKKIDKKYESKSEREVIEMVKNKK